MRRTTPGPEAPGEEPEAARTVEGGCFAGVAGPDLRARIISDLRDLADFLQEHPELPISSHTSVDVSYFPRTSHDEAAFAEVDEAGARLGRAPVWEGEHYMVEDHRGAGRYRVVAIPEHTRARYRAWLTYTGHVRPD